jgi:hypothetical protein
MSSPADFASGSELRGNGAGIYHLADGVSDEEFEDALGQAKAGQDLSRANVVRKIRQRRATQPGPAGRFPGPVGQPLEAAARCRELIGQFAASGMSSRQIGARLGIGDDRVRQIAREHGITIGADVVLGRSRRLDSTRIARETVHALEGLAMAVGLADPSAIDPAEATEWAASMTRSIRALSKFTRQMKEIIR